MAAGACIFSQRRCFPDLKSNFKLAFVGRASRKSESVIGCGGKKSKVLLTRFAPAGAGALLPSQFGSAPEVDAVNPGHRQIIEATLICLEAIGRTKPHSVVAMEYEAK
jgi:hypothetical protein